MVRGVPRLIGTIDEGAGANRCPGIGTAIIFFSFLRGSLWHASGNYDRKKKYPHIGLHVVSSKLFEDEFYSHFADT